MDEAAFFESVYVGARDNGTDVPWQQAPSRRLISNWIEGFTPATSQQRALVVAAGLGDDAAALSRRCLRVTAFDFSPTAVAWASSTHTDVEIEWHVADLFNLPKAWLGGFDLVVEVFTIQSIPPPRQHQATQVVRDLVKPGGKLVAVTIVNGSHRQPDGPPWPIPPSTLDALTHGFTTSSSYSETLDEELDCLLVELDRPGPAGTD